jgi:hypothetical protein
LILPSKTCTCYYGLLATVQKHHLDEKKHIVSLPVLVKHAKMKAIISLTALLMASSASAHTIFVQLVAGGETYRELRKTIAYCFVEGLN